MLQPLLWVADALFFGMVVGIPLYAILVKKVDAFGCFKRGGEEALDIAKRLLPFLVGMLVAISMLRASGAFEWVGRGLAPLLRWLGVDPALLPLMLARPFSGSASNAILVDVIHHAGGNAPLAHTAATMMGSTETTIYLLAVYLGAVGLQRSRYVLWLGLLSDASGMLAAIYVCRWLL